MQFGHQGLSLTGLTIVLVEDDPTLRQLTVDILTDLGGVCLAFETADDALIRMLEIHGEFSLVLADHGVPGELTGAELLAMTNVKWPAIPTIISSGYRLENEHDLSRSKYLFKPWSLDELIQTIKSAMTSAALPTYSTGQNHQVK